MAVTLEMPIAATATARMVVKVFIVLCCWCLVFQRICEKGKSVLDFIVEGLGIVPLLYHDGGWLSECHQ